MNWEDVTDKELVAEFKRRFADAKTTANLLDYEYVSGVNTLVHRRKLTRHRIASRFAVYSRSEIEHYLKHSSGRQGRPKKDE